MSFGALITTFLLDDGQPRSVFFMLTILSIIGFIQGFFLDDELELNEKAN